MDSAPSLADGDRYSQGAKRLSADVAASPAVPTAIQRGWRIECCRRTGALIRAAAHAELSNLLNIEVASPFQYFGDQCCIESLGKLPPKGLGHYMVNVSAISPNSLPRLPGVTASDAGSTNTNTRRAGTTRRGGGRSQHTGRAATPATGLCRLFPVLSSLWRVCRHPLLLLPASHPVF